MQYPRLGRVASGPRCASVRLVCWAEDGTSHGLRAREILNEVLRGASLEFIMQKRYWKGPLAAWKYVGLLLAMVGREFQGGVTRRHTGFVQDMEEVHGGRVRPSSLRLA